MKRSGLLDTLIAVFATLACAIVALGLADTPREPISTAPPVALPSGTLRDAELTVVAENADGRALAGVSVVAFWRNGEEFFWTGRRRTTQDGRAHFTGLPRGVFWLVAEKGGYRRTSTELTLADAPREARVRLGPASLLNVSVSDEAGAAIDQATVLVEDIDPLPHGGLTSAEGAVRFERLGPPPWRIRVSARGFATEERELAEDATVTLRRLGALSVHVVSSNGAPAPEATVVISGARLWPARKTTTNTAGIATITGLLDGAYDLSATRGDQVSQTLVGFSLAEGRHDEVTLMLGAGRTIRISVVEGET
ncbi:MAG TPA: carboxypeptidase-like regulatory domain-containing protein, partial [Polyangiaceae bacterium]|nr:carboxypeptidase-like regulatory domain-containing protein [Polyangiaceae bacterium]